MHTRGSPVQSHDLFSTLEGNGEGALGRVEAGVMILIGVSLEVVLEKAA